MMKALGRFRCRRVETGDNGHLQMKSAKNARPTERFDIRSGISRLLFLAELLESGIGAQRVPDWIEL
jgi:hypothetical protein